MFPEWEKRANEVVNVSLEDSEKENCCPFEGTSQIQINANIEELKCNSAKNQLHKIESIQKDVEDLHEMYQNLNEMVGTQAEAVENIENSVEETHQNVESGTKELAKAHK